MSFVEWLDRHTPPAPTEPSAADVIADQIATNLWNRLKTGGFGWATQDEIATILRQEGETILAGLEAARYAVVKLPEPDELDDDGQLWFGDYDIRVDTTGRGPAEVYLGGGLTDLDVLERHAVALLAAVAAAREADNA